MRSATKSIVGPIVAQTILQRALYVRTHFTFKLSWEYCLLDPMDIVDDHRRQSRAFRHPGAHHRDRGGRQGPAGRHGGGADASAFRRRPSIPTQVDQHDPSTAASPPPVNAPLIFEPPPALTGNIAAGLGRRVGRLRRVADRTGAAPLSGRRSTTRPIRRSARSPSRCGQGVLRPPICRRQAAGTRPIRLRSTSPKAAARSQRHRPSLGAGRRHACLVDSELLAYETRRSRATMLQPDRARARALRTAAAAFERRAVRAAQPGGRQLQSAGQLYRPDALFQIPDLQRVRRRRAGSLDLHGLSVHADRRRHRPSDRGPIALRARARSRASRRRACPFRRLRDGHRRDDACDRSWNVPDRSGCRASAAIGMAVDFGSVA